jgi:predicted metal-binding membrane protein
MSSIWAPPRVSRTTVAVGLIVATLAAWIVTADRMRGMDAGPGTSLGGLGWYLGVWVTMTAAMMLPSTAPMVVLFDRVSAERARRGQAHVPTSIFVLAYLLVWAAYGLVAYGLYRIVVHALGGPLAWDRAGPYVAGAVVAAAGLYELTPLKSACLRHCRSPLAFVVGGWREGPLGALRMGAVHGSYCVGCCWGLMLVLFTLGVMSLTWMAAVAALVFVPKVLPGGEATTRLFAVGFVAAGVWIAASPGSVPGLVEPDSGAARRARDRMMHMEPRPAVPAAPGDMHIGTGDGMGP